MPTPSRMSNIRISWSTNLRVSLFVLSSSYQFLALFYSKVTHSGNTRLLFSNYLCLFKNLSPVPLNNIYYLTVREEWEPGWILAKCHELKDSYKSAVSYSCGTPHSPDLNRTRCFWSHLHWCCEESVSYCLLAISLLQLVPCSLGFILR